ncbi:CNH-domain-containing protein [Gymnopus androsaceus JB14]|uniref:CNH-domain-containing protein n=1 Tax=Gymnopus androsaceus JB14 TaxID=1447944 RepID=A0A6A4HNF1_9AGAR|nr:CNH-domain-containing protein [Gymnopus androsaceus JB14]
MDRPTRQPPAPDKRNEAFESIFGRPTASHHHQTLPQAPYPPPQPNYYYQQQPQYYHQNSDRRTSFQQHHYSASPYTNSTLNTPSNIPPNAYQRYTHSAYNYAPSLAPPSISARARSIHSNTNGLGIIAPKPEEPPDPSLEALTKSGLTPAQAYQAQIYRNTTPSSLPAVDNDDGRLGIDFAAEQSNSSDQSTDDSSELPWARNESTPSAPPNNRYSNASTNPSLHVDTASAQSIRSSVASTSPSSFTLGDYNNSVETATSSTVVGAGRRSSESAHLPRLAGSTRRDRSNQDRSMSMSAATTSMRAVLASRVPGAPEGGRNSPGSVKTHTRKTPIVYPALLSRVAEAFRDRIQLVDRLKDGLTYKNAFDGREAVDKIAYIIKTTDRNLALLLGRALDAQKFFHDVTYDHRLRDSASELYQFRTKLPSPFVSGELASANSATSELPTFPTAIESPVESGEPSSPSPSVQPRPRKGSIGSDEVELPSGVFTLLTDCYSPTCSRDQLCYSIACPRRLEQQARLNMKPQPGLSKQISKESLNDTPDDGTLWIHSVPQEIVNSVSDTEKKRQEAINEVIYTERDFVRDMEYLRDVWIKRLQESDVIPEDRRTAFLEQVFWNVFDIIAVNTRVRDALVKRQKQYAVVEYIGDILLDAVPFLGNPFVSYGSHQLYGKYEFEKEKNSNPAFAQLPERLPESRKLELNAYLTKPTTRLARYPLLLEAVLKHTPENSPDKTTLPQAVSAIREILSKVNTASGKAENRFNLIQLDSQLVWRPGEEVPLRLREEGREMIYKGALNKRDGELQVYLFDHAMLFTKVVKIKQHEQFKVYRPPIPLELLLITASEDANTNGNNTLRGNRHRQGLVKKGSFSRDSRSSPMVPPAHVKPDAKGQFWINFVHLGRRYYNLVLWANSSLTQKKWLENIYKQQQAIKDRSTIFETVSLSEGFFNNPNKVNCAAPFSGGRKIAYGTDDGVYFSDLREVNKDPVKVLALLDVTQIDVLEDYQLLIVLSERQVITFPLEALDPIDPLAGLKRAKRIASHTTFFKAGYCLGRMLVCIVKSSQLSSTFKALEPIDQGTRGRAKPTFRKLLQGGNDTLKLFREFYIPVESTSIHYLKTKLCVGCSRGFEIVDLETLDTQGLLDPNDESLEFVRKRDNLRPMAIYRIQNEFLLCYDEFAFYVNKTGRRSRKEFMVHWEGVPTGFALHEPYVLAFEPTFVEIRHIETGLMTQVIQGSNLRLLFADNPPSMTGTGPQAGAWGSPNPGMYHPGYEPNPYNGYQSYGGRPGYGGYGAPPPPPQMQYPMHTSVARLH